MSVSGLRVLRGPDWRGGDTDGGEGHVGTVIELLSNHTVCVLWDMGQESTCSTGHDGKCELQIFDTAPIGVCHHGTTCVECGDTDLYGMLWRCQLCTGCDLCPLCYHDDKHDRRHQFLRIDISGTEGIPVPKRKTSVKNRALGIFPGAKVTRGKDWQWGDQDGGQGSEGEVKGYENVSPDSSRNLVKVHWPNSVANTYRLGFYGYVDVTCVEEEAGPCYYRDHLPVLDTTTSLFSACPWSESAAEASSDLSKGDNCGHEPSEADDRISHTSPAQASNTADNSFEKVTERAALSTHWRKEDSGIVVDRDTDHGEASTDSAGKGRLSQQCVLSPSTIEEKRDEKAVGDCERDTPVGSDQVTSSSKTGETTDASETQTVVAGATSSSETGETTDTSETQTCVAGAPSSSETGETTDTSETQTCVAGAPSSSETGETTDTSETQTCVAGATSSSETGETTDTSETQTCVAGAPSSSETGETTDTLKIQTFVAGAPSSSETGETTDTSETQTCVAGATSSSATGETTDTSETQTCVAGATSSSATGETTDTSETQTCVAGATSNSATGETKDTLKIQTFVAGDKVAIKVTDNILMQLQENCWGHTEEMKTAMGETGEVVSVAVSGAVTVRFTSCALTFHPQALTKVLTLKAGSTVRIREKEEEVKILNARVGWRGDMHATLGKAGRVLNIDSDGDVLVSFGHHHFLFAPACCVPVPHTKPDSLSIESGGKLPQIPVVKTSNGEAKTPARDEVTETVKGKNRELYHSLREAMKADSRPNITHTRGGLLSLLGAIQSHDHVTVRQKIMADRSLLEGEHHPDLTPLIFACVLGKKSRRVVDTLLELGADVNHGMPPCKTPLYSCLQGQSEDLVVVLLEAGADAFAVDEQCHTYMHYAAAFGLVRAIRAFAAYGVDVNVKDDYGDTALHVAIEKFKVESVAALVQLDNIDLHLTNKRDFSALHLACLRGNPYALQCILERDTSEVNDLHHGQNTALHTAATNDHDECIRLLVLLGGADVNVRDMAGANYTPLHLACIEAKFKAAEALMEMGADLNVQESKGDTPLHFTMGGKQERDIASEAGRQECQLRVAIACMLISNGAYVDIENRKGRNPLSYGVTPVQEEVRRFVEQNEALVKLKGPGGGVIGAVDNLQSLAVSLPFSASLLAGKGEGKLKEALKGVGLPCGLCGASKSDVTLLPCQHKCVCSTCSDKVTLCPLCDEEVKEKVAT
ncbi:E3 ubiquitin-protein ligase MIB2-like isoform X2 [Littorina saxatilis]|uniref:RING-type E3 ubiquitin transferase n=1 Tax=Littorina saxatilis TaxID=31220 RepID=A0AAN9AU47_9CAEN